MFILEQSIFGIRVFGTHFYLDNIGYTLSTIDHSLKTNFKKAHAILVSVNHAV